MKKKIDAFYGRNEYSWFDEIVDTLIVPCLVSAVTTFLVTLIILL